MTEQTEQIEAVELNPVHLTHITITGTRFENGKVAIDENHDNATLYDDWPELVKLGEWVFERGEVDDRIDNEDTSESVHGRGRISIAEYDWIG
jgi:hypothetical protein